MSQIHIIGLDLAKQIFQVHAITSEGAVVMRRQLRRSQVLTFFTKLPSCLVGMESLKALVPDPSGFVSGRHFAAWLGLTPRAHSSGGKERLGRISKMGNPTLRTLLILGATTVLRHARNGGKASP